MKPLMTKESNFDDYFGFDAIGVPLEICMKLAASDTLFSKPMKVVGWSEHQTEKFYPDLILYCYTPTNKESYNSLPAPIDPDDAIGIIKSWLEKSEYGIAPDCDGSTKRGWRVRSYWDHKVFCIVSPQWLEYHK